MWFEEILCYPLFSKEEFENRLKELKEIGIEDLIEGGNTTVLGRRIIGKGTTSLVVKALYKGKLVALKIRRLDSNRESMEKEANILQVLSNQDFVPKLFSFSKNFLILEYLEGTDIDVFLEKAEEEEIKSVVKQIISICIKLDELGIDHGELSNASDHVLVDKNLKVKIIDFESASLNRKPQNITSILSYLFISNKPFSEKVLKAFGLKREDVINASRDYKKGIKDSLNIFFK